MFGQHRLRTTLMITLVLTALVPMVLAGFFSYYFISDNITVRIKTNNEVLARAFVEDVRSILKEPQLVLSQVVNFLTSHPHSQNEIDHTLDITVRGASYFESIYMVDRSGRILHAGLVEELAANRQDLLGINLSGNLFFQEALKAKVFPVWSDTFLSLFTGRVSITICVPYGENFVIGSFRVDHLHEMISAHSAGTHLVISIFDGNGTLIFHPSRLLVDQKLNLSRMEPVMAGLAGEQGTYRYQFNNEDYLGSVAQVRKNGWLVCVSQPYDEAYAPLRKLRFYFMIIGLLGIGAAFCLALFIGRRFSGPINTLGQNAHAIAEGDYEQSVPQLRYIELEDLAEDFREMAKSIRKRQQLLSESYSRVQNQLRFQQAMMDTITMPIFFVDNEGSCLGCNRAFEKATGISREEWLGRNVAAESSFGIVNCFLAIEDFSTLRKDLLPSAPQADNNGEGELRTFESTVRYADGTNHYLIYYSKPFLNDDGNQGGLVCVCLDISERKKTERALQQSEERLKLAMEATELGIWTVNIQTGKGFVDRKWAEMLDYELAEVEPDLETWSKMVHPTDRKRMEKALSDHLHGRKDYYECEVRFLTKAGGWKWILDRGKITEWDKNGKPLRLAGTHKDITEIKKMEEELRQAQKMEAIGTLAGGIAHDFNNMLNAIIGYTELALLDLPQASPVSENLVEVITAGKRAAVLVKQILTFSRQSEQEKKIVRIQSVLKEILKLLRGTLPTTIEIRHNISPDCGPILADMTQIHQVVMNICTNAFHAMRDNGGILEVTMGEEQVEASSPMDMPEIVKGRYVVLRVKDTGIGMDQATKSRIFDPYFTTKGLGEGTGLGLSTVHGIVKSHRGYIRVLSEPGQGTLFEVYFPVQEGAQETGDEKRRELSELPRLAGHVMLVDDEEVMVDFSRKILEKCGCRVSTFTRSVEALAAFKDDPGRFDLIITDQTMPELTGLSFAVEVLRVRPDIPVVLATGYSENVDEEKAKKAGIRVFMMKPLEIEFLVKTVQELLPKSGL